MSIFEQLTDMSKKHVEAYALKDYLNDNFGYSAGVYYRDDVVAFYHGDQLCARKLFMGIDWHEISSVEELQKMFQN